jgi:NhaA family Na+:H+ antiporter
MQSALNSEPEVPAPPGSWLPLRRLAYKALAPVERFLAVEAASGILLLAVAVIALIWANSPWSPVYVNLWHTPLGLRLGPFAFERDLHFWINDGLMTIFFFVVGLEIRREIHHGELSQLKRAALPIAAAVGGMALPALVFLLLNQGRASSVGWGVPTATDIAFAVGVLTLLGKRVPAALRILLLALAVIDDVGAILVIAFFYSSELAPLGFAVAAAGLLAIVALQRVGVRSPWAYLPPALVTWGSAYAAGIHPTLAGVAIGLMTPVTPWYGRDRFVAIAETQVKSMRAAKPDDQRALLPHLDKLTAVQREAVSPVERLEHALHGWVAYAIMPLFALANAGVPLGAASFEGDGLRVFLGVLIGLVIGKPLGVLGLAWLAAKAGVTSLPRGVTWAKLWVVGLCAGIGFTMALFIAQLAFPPGPLLETAKLAVLCASGVAAGLAFLVGQWVLKTDRESGQATTAAEAEASTVA